ncbi:MAG: methylmalonyl Co-A mutase-associated GTPase MeaB [Candidatus Geothermincolia bacterium]
MEDPGELLERLLRGDRRAAARLISMVEDRLPGSDEVVKRLHGRTGKAHIIGITGSPGTGKSTLVSGLAREMRRRDRSIGIIAVDPTSPFTGGALLGDRIRMGELALDPEVFIRSMGTRGALGGLAAATNDAINVLDAFGKDVIIVETVGAGQVEVDIVRYAHTSIVLTMPGGGDEIQAIKAGIMEIGDIFCVNKADREGADRALAELRLMLDVSGGYDAAAWKPPVLAASALTGAGVAELVNAVEEHRAYLVSHALLEAKRRERARAELLEIIGGRVAGAVTRALDETGPMAGIIERVADTRELDPHTAAGMVVEHLLRHSAGDGGLEA